MKRRSLLLVGFLLSSFPIYAAPWPTNMTLEQTKKAIYSDPATFSTNRIAWRAEEIAVAGRLPMNWGDVGFDQSFKSETAALPDVATNVQGLTAEGGVLRFVTGTNAMLYWGNYLNETNIPPLAIGARLNDRWYPLRVGLRIRQTLPESHWKVALKGWMQGEFAVKGTNWTDVVTGLQRTGMSPIGGVCLTAQESGNTVEIERLAVFTPSAVQCFRKELELPDEPAAAALTINKQPYYRLWINGQLVKDVVTDIVSCDKDLNLKDLEAYFRKGKNVIAIESEVYQWGSLRDQIVVEGAVRCRNGQVMRILSDASWKGMYAAPAGWEKPDYDVNAWSNAAAFGKPKQGYGYDTSFTLLNPPYYGPIEFGKPEGRSMFIFDAGKAATVPVTIYARNVAGIYNATWRIADAESERVFKEGVLVQGQSGDKAYRGMTELGVLAPGAYEFAVEVVQSGTVFDRRIEEVLVVGRVEQREVEGKNYIEGMDLELTDDIELTDPKSPYAVVSQDWNGNPAPSAIVDSPAGKYRESGHETMNWFALAVKLDRLYDPYLLEVEVPDDKPRVLGISVFQMIGCALGLHGGNAAECIASGGVTSGFDHRLTNRMTTFRMVFFPKVSLLGIEFANVSHQNIGAGAAAARIRIYRIKNGLPALKTAAPDQRWVGVHLERMTPLLPSTFYAGPDEFKFSQNCDFMFRGFMKDWYNTGKHMIEYMRFAGENLIVPGIYMYYPENGRHWPNKEGANSLEILGRMLGANGLKMLLGVEYARPFMGKAPQVTDEDVAKGAKTYRLVDRFGRQTKNWVSTCSPFVPEVREDLKSVITDLARLYKGNPGVAGIALIQGGGLLPDFNYGRNVKDPLDLGYDDCTVGLFEKETGIRIPETGKQTTDDGRRTTDKPKDPGRFGKRYDWLMANTREQWIDWRNRKVHEINRELAEVIARENPDWKLVAIPIMVGDVGQDFRRFSFDPALYRGDPRIVFGHRTDVSLHDAVNLAWGREQHILNPDVWQAVDEGVWYACNGFYDDIHHAKWYWNLMGLCPYSAPADRNFLYPFARVLANSTPRYIAETWCDADIKTGNEQERREFNRAFRALPQGPYRTLTGNGLDKNLAVRVGPAVTEGTPYYVVNPGAWPVAVRLGVKLEKGAQVRDLALGTVWAERGFFRNPREFALDLKPYELKSLMIRGAVTAAEVKPMPQALKDLEALGREKASIYRNVERIGEKRMARGLEALGSRQIANAVMKRAQAIVAADDAGDWLTVMNLTDDYPSQQIERFIQIMTRYLDTIKELKTGYHVDCGAKADWTNSTGQVWLADREWLGGAGDWGYWGGNVVDRGNITVQSAKPGDERMYQTERYQVKKYCFRLKPGAYRVRLYFMEDWCATPNQRLFNASIQGRNVLERFDILKEAGDRHRAVVKEFAVELAMSEEPIMEIAFAPILDSTKIDGIEIVRVE